MREPYILGVHRSMTHNFSKSSCHRIFLEAGLGVRGDVHAGKKVKHEYLARKSPQAANLRQVHLIHAELLDELVAKGFEVAPGNLGENITTSGLALLDLPRGSRLLLGDAVVEITGLRNPCVQMDRFQEGLMEAVLERLEDGSILRKCGVMAVVVKSGWVGPGDTLGCEFPKKPYLPLLPV